MSCSDEPLQGGQLRLPVRRFVVKGYWKRMQPNLLFQSLLASCEQADVGLADGYILDSQLTASFELNANTPAKNGRLNYTAGSSWCASTNDSNPYLQIDLQTLHIICAVSTQGNSQADEWVETYTLKSSTDGTTWTDYNENGQVKVQCSLYVELFARIQNY